MRAPEPRAPRWQCVVCRSTIGRPAWDVPADRSEAGVDPESFRPAADLFGQTVSKVMRCLACGHGSLADLLPQEFIDDAYAAAVDEVSLHEEAGQVETASRGLARLERHVAPGRLVDLGCWTGSFVVAATRRGWDASGVEPSAWAAARATARGARVHEATIESATLDRGEYGAAALCDVLEHLVDPAGTLGVVREALCPGGALYLTVPDAGSPMARALGKRWWSVLPMHVQYFTRGSLERLLHSAGFEIVTARTHAKSFSRRYYGQRAAVFMPRLAAVARHIPHPDQLMSPDFRDRVEVIARRVDAKALSDRREVRARLGARCG